MALNIPDIINGCFEAGIGLLAWLNVKAIRRDKSIKGVHWGITAWASTWGLYNLYFYPHLHQWFSFAGGCVIFAANTTWLVYAWRYRQNK